MKQTYYAPSTESVSLASWSVIAASDGNPSGNLPGFNNGDFTL